MSQADRQVGPGPGANAGQSGEPGIDGCPVGLLPLQLASGYRFGETAQGSDAPARYADGVEISRAQRRRGEFIATIDEPAHQCGCGDDAELLVDHGAHAQLERVPVAQRSQPRDPFDARLKNRASAEFLVRGTGILAGSEQT